MLDTSNTITRITLDMGTHIPQEIWRQHFNAIQTESLVSLVCTERPTSWGEIPFILKRGRGAGSPSQCRIATGSLASVCVGCEGGGGGGGGGGLYRESRILG